MEKNQKPVASHASIIGIFVLMVLFLSIPLILFSTTQNQDIRQKAAQIMPSRNILQPLDTTGFISGYVFFDQNKDGERNYSEKSAARIQIKITQISQDSKVQSQVSNLITTLSSDENGYFKYKFSDSYNQPNTYIIQLLLPDGYKTLDTNPQILKNIKNGTKEVVEFGIYSIYNY